MLGKKKPKEQRYVSRGKLEQRKAEGWKEVGEKKHKLDGSVDAVLMEK